MNFEYVYYVCIIMPLSIALNCVMYDYCMYMSVYVRRGQENYQCIYINVFCICT